MKAGCHADGHRVAGWQAKTDNNTMTHITLTQQPAVSRGNPTRFP